MIAADPMDWLTFLGIGSEAGENIAEQISRQKLLLNMARHPYESYFRGRRIPKSFAARLNQLKCTDGSTFDPTLPGIALKMLERGLSAATRDIGSKLVLDTVLGIEADEQIKKRWSAWFESGSFWPRLVRMHWHSITSHTADSLLMWARDEGVDKITGGDDAISTLTRKLKQLAPKDVVPAEWLEAVENADTAMRDHDW